MGAHQVVNVKKEEELKKIAGSLQFVLSTANANLPWGPILDTLGPKGKLHLVGVTPEPIPVSAFSLIGTQKSISGSPLGSPATTAKMLDFCARHSIAPVTEHFKLSQANEALQHLHEGKARYRIVLENDLG